MDRPCITATENFAAPGYPDCEALLIVEVEGTPPEIDEQLEILRTTTDVDALSAFLQTGLTTAVVSVLTLTGVLVALVVLDAELALVLVAVLPVLAVGGLLGLAAWRRRPHGRR